MRATGVICLTTCVLLLGAGYAGALTIYDIQFSTGPEYVSPYLGETVTVTGGIVTKVFVGSRTKITIQDPTLGDAWTGIQVVFDDPSQAEDIVRGDQVDFFDVVVDEFRGNTQLIIEPAGTFAINSSGNTVEPLVVSVAEIPVPTDNDLSEKYEFMLLTVEAVHVGQMDLGNHADNYELYNAEGVCWAADYANEDLLPGEIYHVQAGDTFDSVTGYLEQYYRPEQSWNYYQLLPRDAEDYVYGTTPVRDTTWGDVKALFSE